MSLQTGKLQLKALMKQNYQHLCARVFFLPYSSLPADRPLQEMYFLNGNFGRISKQVAAHSEICQFSHGCDLLVVLLWIVSVPLCV